LVGNPQTGDAEADKPAQAKREGWCNATVLLRNIRARIGPEENPMSDDSQKYACNQVGDIVLLGEQRGKRDQ
jgi:hypothetical protein